MQRHSPAAGAEATTPTAVARQVISKDVLGNVAELNLGTWFPFCEGLGSGHCFSHFSKRICVGKKDKKRGCSSDNQIMCDFDAVVFHCSFLVSKIGEI